jgi:hypothetical protein
MPAQNQTRFIISQRSKQLSSGGSGTMEQLPKKDLLHKLNSQTPLSHSHTHSLSLASVLRFFFVFMSQSGNQEGHSCMALSPRLKEEESYCFA